MRERRYKELERNRDRKKSIKNEVERKRDVSRWMISRSLVENGTVVVVRKKIVAKVALVKHSIQAK